MFICQSKFNKAGGKKSVCGRQLRKVWPPLTGMCLCSQDDYMEALARLHLTVTRAYKVNTDINFEVFIHKVDGLSDDHKIETQRDIHQRANDDLADAGLEKIHLR